MQKSLPFAGCLLVSDLDGTLIGRGGEIPQRNIDAIHRFTQEGGLFALATGRSDMASRPYAELAGVNAPSILYNGAAIYDFESGRFLWSRYLPDTAAGVVRDVAERFPGVGVEFYSDGVIYITRSNAVIERHIRYESLRVVSCGMDALPGNWNKVLFAAEHETLLEVEKYVLAGECGCCECVMSSDTYYEMLPAGVTKGSTVKVLADMLKIGYDRIMGIGDYYNDRKLLEEAALAAVPAQAPEDIRKLADVVVCGNGEGAVAEFIEYIEKLHG